MTVPRRTPESGITSFVTVATDRVARRLRVEPDHHTDPDVSTSLLAAIALAVDGGHPEYVARILPRPSVGLGERLVEMLRAELLKSWAEKTATTSAAAVLDALTGLEQVRQALRRNLAAPPGEGFVGADADALDLFFEVVHDLRSPLTSMLCLADTLQRGQSGDVNTLQHRQLGLIYSSALGLSGLVNDALELARGSDVLADGDPAPFSVSELLHAAADIVEPMAEEKALWVRLHTIEPDRRLGHPMALSRVFLNLTSNALKFTEKGGVDLHCEARGPNRVQFSVQDTGPGINPLALASLYEPFRRARGRAGYCFSGTGLGLAISRKLIRAMGSELQLETGNNGTRFFFELDLPVLQPH